MKTRYLLFIAFILSICPSSFSQTIDRSFSIKGGFNLANIIGKNTDDFEYNKGIMIGLSKSVWPTYSRFNSQIELFFSMKGAYVNYVNEFDDKIEVFYDLYYIEFPFMIKYKMRKGNAENNDTNIFLNFGCAFGFNILAEADEGNDNIRNISSEIYNQELGLVAGASFESRFRNQQKYSLEFRYNRSLMNILETDNYKNYNEVFSIVLGLSILEL